MKQGVAAALDRMLDPDLRWAVVFDSDRWHPSQPPAGSEWDYEPFASLDSALAELANPRPGETSHELWEKRDGAWHQITDLPEAAGARGNERN